MWLNGYTLWLLSVNQGKILFQFLIANSKKALLLDSIRFACRLALLSKSPRFPHTNWIIKRLKVTLGTDALISRGGTSETFSKSANRKSFTINNFPLLLINNFSKQKEYRKTRLVNLLNTVIRWAFKPRKMWHHSAVVVVWKVFKEDHPNHWLKQKKNI